MSLMAGPISPALTPDGILLSPSINIIVKRQAFPSQRKWKSLSHVQLFVTPWTVVHGILQARILKWVAYPFSSGSSRPRNQTGVSCIAERFFTNWTIKNPCFPLLTLISLGSSLHTHVSQKPSRSLMTSSAYRLTFSSLGPQQKVWRILICSTCFFDIKAWTSAAKNHEHSSHLHGRTTSGSCLNDHYFYLEEY